MDTNIGTLEQRVLATIRREHLLSKGDKVLVALSGGADSMALLTALLSLAGELELAGVAAAHLNHSLRGEEADRDEQAAREWCRRQQVPFFARKVDVAAVARQQGLGLEEAGRQQRYAFLEELCEQEGFTAIATAHTLNDNMETVLLHMARGCGLNGLCGIPYRRGRIVRPLLDCSRQEIEDYCAAKAIPYVTDSTNADPAFARNRVRARVLPELYRLNSGADEAFRRMLRRIREDEAYLRQQAQAAAREAQLPDGSFRCSAIAGLPAALRSRVIALATGGGYEERHIAEIENILVHGGAVTLPGGRIAQVRQGRLAVESPGKPAASPQDQAFCHAFAPEELRKDGATFVCGEKTYEIRVMDRKKYQEYKNIYKTIFHNSCSYDIINGTVYVRSRRPGDRYHPAGRGCGKTLKKLFNEAGIPVEERGTWPILCDQEGIVLVPGFGADQRAAVTEQTATVLVLQPVERKTSEANEF